MGDDKVIPFKGPKSPNNEDKNNVDEIREKVRETFSEEEEKLEKEAKEGDKDSGDVVIAKSEGVLIKVKNSFISLRSQSITVEKNVHTKNAHTFKRIEIVAPKKILLLGLLALIAIAGVLILSKDYSSLWPQKEDKAFDQEGGKSLDVAPLYIASKDSRVFHRAGCRLAERIYKGNLVTFSSRDEAVRSGRDPYKMCMP